MVHAGLSIDSERKLMAVLTIDFNVAMVFSHKKTMSRLCCKVHERFEEEKQRSREAEK